MKNEIPPAVMAGIIAVVVVVIALVGYKYMNGGKQPSLSSAEMQKKMAEHPGAYSGMPTSGSGQHRQGSPNHP